jgi:hypothetical protein
MLAATYTVSFQVETSLPSEHPYLMNNSESLSISVVRPQQLNEGTSQTPGMQQFARVLCMFLKANTFSEFNGLTPVESCVLVPWRN